MGGRAGELAGERAMEEAARGRQEIPRKRTIDGRRDMPRIPTELNSTSAVECTWTTGVARMNVIDYPGKVQMLQVGLLAWRPIVSFSFQRRSPFSTCDTLVDCISWKSHPDGEH